MLKREKKISPAISGRLDCLATAYSIARQIDVVMCRDFLRDLELQIRAGPQNREFSEEAHEKVQKKVVDSLSPLKSFLRLCTTKSIRNRLLQV